MFMYLLFALQIAILCKLFLSEEYIAFVFKSINPGLVYLARKFDGFFIFLVNRLNKFASAIETFRLTHVHTRCEYPVEGNAIVNESLANNAIVVQSQAEDNAIVAEPQAEDNAIAAEPQAEDNAIVVQSQAEDNAIAAEPQAEDNAIVVQSQAEDTSIVDESRANSAIAAEPQAEDNAIAASSQRKANPWKKGKLILKREPGDPDFDTIERARVANQPSSSSVSSKSSGKEESFTYQEIVDFLLLCLVLSRKALSNIEEKRFGNVNVSHQGTTRQIWVTYSPVPSALIDPKVQTKNVQWIDLIQVAYKYTPKRFNPMMFSNWISKNSIPPRSSNTVTEYIQLHKLNYEVDFSEDGKTVIGIYVSKK